VGMRTLRVAIITEAAVSVSFVFIFRIQTVIYYTNTLVCAVIQVKSTRFLNIIHSKAKRYKKI
jgi:hypothetical protein